MLSITTYMQLVYLKERKEKGTGKLFKDIMGKISQI
jgi:hypothetical protein